MPDDQKIAVIGLGYVGLPLAVALARHYQVTGFDIDGGRIAELRRGHDRTGEVTDADLAATGCVFTERPEEIATRDVYIVTVPTPVDIANEPDLSALRAAARTVGGAMDKGAVVVFESTVFPGVTEDICGPIIAEASGLVCGRDFFLGYSPERINPGDREHTIDRIVKVVAGQTPAVTERLAALYGQITSGGVFQARDIKTAEAAKVIENAQRDINIAFINEVTMIFRRLGLSAHDVLEAARSKWNFLDFRPGLVGGHCIGVDPYYLARCAQDLGHHPEILLAGRRINDNMGAWLADTVNQVLDGKNSRILILGLTFKEDLSDLRNTRVVDIVARLRQRGHEVDVHDPLAAPEDARELCGVTLLPNLDEAHEYSAVVGAVAHRAYRALTADQLTAMLASDGLLADVKGIWQDIVLPNTVRRWTL